MQNQNNPHPYLFRGKRIDGQGWVEGSLVLKKRALPGVMVAIGAELTDNFKLVAFIFPITNLSPLPFEVEPETVGQVFTTNLERLPTIAIGDVVEVKGRKKVGTYFAEIVHSQNGGYTLSENKTYFNNDAILSAIIRVAGNKFDNLDLLK